MGQVFINESKVYFNLRNKKANKPTSVYMVTRIKGKQYKLSTGVKIYPEQWNDKKQEAYISVRLTELDNQNNLIVNDKIKELKSFYNEHLNYLCAHPEKIGDNLTILKETIYKDRTMKKKAPKENALTKLFEIIGTDRTIKDSSRAQYTRQLNGFETFLRKENKYPIAFHEIDLPLIKEYESYLFNKDNGKGKTTKTTTVGGQVMALIGIIKRAEPLGLFDSSTSKLDKYVKPKSRQGDDNSIYLTEDEIQRMYDLELTGQEEQVRDIFLLLCWTGQRFSDLNKFNGAIIKETPNGKLLELVQEKKTHKVSIPLFEIAETIFNKYKGNIPLVDQKFVLLKIKTIGKKAGITRLHSVTEDRGGKVTTEQKKAYELIGTHTARRSYINNMLKRGYPSHIIMQITGHKTEDAFAAYVKINSEDAALSILDKESKSKVSIQVESKPIIQSEITLPTKQPLQHTNVISKVDNLLHVFTKDGGYYSDNCEGDNIEHYLIDLKTQLIKDGCISDAMIEQLHRHLNNPLVHLEMQISIPFVDELEKLYKLIKRLKESNSI